MIQRDEVHGQPTVISTRGFVFDVECDDRSAPSPERIGELVADALAHVEGLGRVNVGYLGLMENEQESNV
jgi:hypothetical protein